MYGSLGVAPAENVRIVGHQRSGGRAVQHTREDLQDQVIALLHAGRELSPAEDEALADAFVSHLEDLTGPRRRRDGPGRLVYVAASALVILLAIPVVMVIQTYSSLDGYLPRPDAGALPMVYWLALAAVVLLLVGTLVGERSGWRVQLTLRRQLPR
jgi:ABC-type transport system involved in cytochrome bd biosynthesis fused ATPase/permease subunit